MIPSTKTLARDANRYILLAPPSAASSATLFRDWINDSGAYEVRLREMQRLRGGIYLEDGAIISSALSNDGSHRLVGDELSWHILALDEGGAVQGCVRSLPHPPSVRYRDLAVRHAAQEMGLQWSWPLRRAIESQVELAQELSVDFFEVGGWAMAKKLRCTGSVLYSALGAYALAQLLGGGVGFATATVRHRSSEILKRIGGSPLKLGDRFVSPYYDPQYACKMEALSFDSRSPNVAFSRRISLLKELLRSVSVLCAAESALAFQGCPRTAH